MDISTLFTAPESEVIDYFNTGITKKTALSIADTFREQRVSEKLIEEFVQSPDAERFLLCKHSASQDIIASIGVDTNQRSDAEGVVTFADSLSLQALPQVVQTLIQRRETAIQNAMVKLSEEEIILLINLIDKILEEQDIGTSDKSFLRSSFKKLVHAHQKWIDDQFNLGEVKRLDKYMGRKRSSEKMRYDEKALLLSTLEKMFAWKKNRDKFIEQKKKLIPHVLEKKLEKHIHFNERELAIVKLICSNKQDLDLFNQKSSELKSVFTKIKEKTYELKLIEAEAKLLRNIESFLLESDQRFLILSKKIFEFTVEDLEAVKWMLFRVGRVNYPSSAIKLTHIPKTTTSTEESVTDRVFQSSIPLLEAYISISNELAKQPVMIDEILQRFTKSGLRMHLNQQDDHFIKNFLQKRGVHIDKKITKKDLLKSFFNVLIYNDIEAPVEKILPNQSYLRSLVSNYNAQKLTITDPKVEEKKKRSSQALRMIFPAQGRLQKKIKQFIGMVQPLFEKITTDERKIDDLNKAIESLQSKDGNEEYIIDITKQIQVLKDALENTKKSLINELHTYYTSMLDENWASYYDHPGNPEHQSCFEMILVYITAYELFKQETVASGEKIIPLFKLITQIDNKIFPTHPKTLDQAFFRIVGGNDLLSFLGALYMFSTEELGRTEYNYQELLETWLQNSDIEEIILMREKIMSDKDLKNYSIAEYVMKLILIHLIETTEIDCLHDREVDDEKERDEEDEFKPYMQKSLAQDRQVIYTIERVYDEFDVSHHLAFITLQDHPELFLKYFIMDEDSSLAKVLRYLCGRHEELFQWAGMLVIEKVLENEEEVTVSRSDMIAALRKELYNSGIIPMQSRTRADIAHFIKKPEQVSGALQLAAGTTPDTQVDKTKAAAAKKKLDSLLHVDELDEVNQVDVSILHEADTLGAKVKKKITKEISEEILKKEQQQEQEDSELKNTEQDDLGDTD